MRIIHGSNYTVNQRKKFKLLIIQNLLDSAVRLVNAMHQIFDNNFENEENDANFQIILEVAQIIEKVDWSYEWTKHAKKLNEAIKLIWNDFSIKLTYAKRNKYFLYDATE